MEVEQQVEDFHRFIGGVRENIARLIVGQREVIDQTLIALVAGGHVLLEGNPGLGKTRIVKSLAQILGLAFSRIQFTPDLMPADIVGTTIAVPNERGERTFAFQQGPVFGNVVLADEINRATPKTQSALLEAMEEHAVTVYGKRYPLPNPFFLMATQNPIDMEGTYTLPEAQLDRFFFKILIDQPSAEEMKSIIDLTTGALDLQTKAAFTKEQLVAAQKTLVRVPVATHVKDYAVRLFRATDKRNPEAAPVTKKYVSYGMSPRGVQSLILAGKAVALLQGRFNLSTADIRAVSKPVMRHRLILNFDAEADDVHCDDVVKQIVDSVPETTSRG